MYIRPPDMLSSWNELNIEQRALLISYHQVREIEEMEIRNQELKILATRGL